MYYLKKIAVVLTFTRRILITAHLSFFFEQGKDPKGSRAALIGGVTTYKEDLIIKIKYNQVLYFYKKDPI